MALPKLEVPTYELTLPSTNKKVVYRPFLVKEYKILLTLSQASDDEVSRVVKELVDACTFNKLNTNDLPHFDIEYVFMNLRAKSISEVVDVIITCGNCSNKYDASFNIENLKVEKAANHSNKIMLNDSIGIEMRYPSFDDIVRLIDANDEEIFTMVKKTIKGVFDGDNYYDTSEQTNEELEDFLYSLTKEQFKKIEEFFASCPKVVQEFETTCPSCKTNNKSRIEGLQNFFV